MYHLHQATVLTFSVALTSKNINTVIPACIKLKALSSISASLDTLKLNTKQSTQEDQTCSGFITYFLHGKESCHMDTSPLLWCNKCSLVVFLGAEARTHLSTYLGQKMYIQEDSWYLSPLISPTEFAHLPKRLRDSVWNILASSHKLSPPGLCWEHPPLCKEGKTFFTTMIDARPSCSHRLLPRMHHFSFPPGSY